MSAVDSAINLAYNITVAPFRLTGRILTFAGILKSDRADADACPLFADIPSTAETDKIDAAWPPAPHPVDALSVQDLIRANGKLIRDLCYATTLSEEESQKYLLPVITNLARIVHLTPASEYDHHQGYGGLFTHTLEVAYYAANNAKTAIFDRSASPEELYRNKRRWILTAVLAALLHDIGKPFTDMEITAADGRHWVQDEPIVDWLRKNRIASYYISFRPNREHNRHKAAALANAAMLIPKETFTFLGLTGYGEKMQQELRSAVLEGRNGGLIGRILDNADGLSRAVDGLRQRKIRPEFKNVAHPQGDQILKAVRVLIQSAKWTTNRDEKSRVFNTRQGCFIVWGEEAAKEVRSQALDMGFESLPSDFLRLASVLADAGAALRNSDEISNTHNIFWRVTPIVAGNAQFECIRLADPQLVFDATPPAAMEAIVEGLTVDQVTKDAWVRRWKFLPVQRLTRAEEEEMGYSDEYIKSLTEAAEESLRESEELAGLDAAALTAPEPSDDSAVSVTENEITTEAAQVLEAVPEVRSSAAPDDDPDDPFASVMPKDTPTQWHRFFGEEAKTKTKTVVRQVSSRPNSEPEKAVTSPAAAAAAVGNQPVAAPAEVVEVIDPSADPVNSDERMSPEAQTPTTETVVSEEADEAEVQEYFADSPDDSEEETEAAAGNEAFIDDPWAEQLQSDQPLAVQEPADKEHPAGIDEAGFNMARLLGGDEQPKFLTAVTDGLIKAAERKPRTENPKAKPAASVSTTENSKATEEQQQPDLPLVFFNEPLNADGTPKLPRKGAGGSSAKSKEENSKEPVTGNAQDTSSFGHFAADAAAQKAPVRGKKRRSVVNISRDAKIAQDLAESMVSQLADGFGIWLTEGITTDPLTGRHATQSFAFEKVIAESGIDSDLVELAFEKMASDNVQPRVDWITAEHRLVLVE